MANPALINDRRFKPFENNFLEIVKILFGGLQSEGSMFNVADRTIREIRASNALKPEDEQFRDEGAGRICGSTTSVFGAGRKNRLLSPAVYRAHQGEAFVYPNVNQLFILNQARRNI
jgi:hypothetical protein